MRTWRILAAAGLTAVTVAFAGRAWAAVPDSDSLTITVTPSPDYGLTITTTPAAFLNLGSVELGATAYTTTPATMTIVGTSNSQDMQVQGQILNGPWAFDTDSTNSADKM